MNRCILLLLTAGPIFFGSALAQPATQPATRPSDTAATRPATQPAIDGGMEDAMTGGAMEGTMTGRSTPNRPAATTDSERSIFLRRLSQPEGATIGTMLQGDLTLYTLNERERTLSSLLAEHRPTVIILGSLSSPSFRDRLLDLPWLAREIGRNGELLIVYTREQHPKGGGWQVPRNEQEKILIPAHTTLADRVKLAERVRDADGMRGLTVVVDSMDDALLKAVVGKEAANRPQNSALIVSPDGKVLARQHWFDPSGIPGVLEELNSK